MQLLMSLADDSKQLNQAPFPLRLDYHGPRGIYKIIHQGLMIPGLPSPLHYFNFLIINSILLLGSSKIILYNFLFFLSSFKNATSSAVI